MKVGTGAQPGQGTFCVSSLLSSHCFYYELMATHLRLAQVRLDTSLTGRLV